MPTVKLSDEVQETLPEIQIFENSEFGKVRTVLINNEPYFVGKDVAEKLGYVKTRNAIAMYVDKEDALIQGILSNGGVQKTTLINESGVYSLIFSSKLPKAKRFKHWVTSEVLPALRRNGFYATNPESINVELISSIVSKTVAETVKQLCQIGAIQNKESDEKIKDLIIGVVQNHAKIKGLSEGTVWAMLLTEYEQRTNTSPVILGYVKAMDSLSYLASVGELRSLESLAYEMFISSGC